MDITILDLDNYTFPSNKEIDCKNPLTMARGVKYTIVNGQVAFDDGTMKELNSGQLLGRNGLKL